MANTRSTTAVAAGSGGRTEPLRLAVCTPDSRLAGRICHALDVSGHEVAGLCPGLRELSHDFPLFHADLAVAGVDPTQDAGDLALFRRRFSNVALIAVVPALWGTGSGQPLSSDIDGLVLESEVEQALSPAIASVVAGQLFLPSDARRVLAGPVFSHREKQVLKLLLAGMTNAEIASRLYLSESTVKSHLSSSFRKLGVSSRAEVRRQVSSADAALRIALALERPDTEHRPVPGWSPRPLLAARADRTPESSSIR